jgi:hypothetical protein
MKEWIRTTVKAAVIWGLVGVLFALAAPSLATAIHVAPSSLGIIANPLWLGPFLGGTAALAGALEPAYEFAFGGDHGKPSKALEQENGQEARSVFRPIVEQVRDPASANQVSWAQFVGQHLGVTERDQAHNRGE